jgi:hypothetical protein
MSGDAHQHRAGPIWHQQPGTRKAAAQLHDARSISEFESYQPSQLVQSPPEPGHLDPDVTLGCSPGSNGRPPAVNSGAGRGPLDSCGALLSLRRETEVTPSCARR